MPGMTGVEFLAQVREIQPDAARLIISGYADLNAFADAVNGADIYRFLSKPGTTMYWSRPSLRR